MKCTIYISGGKVGAQVELPPQALIELLHAKIFDIIAKDSRQSQNAALFVDSSLAFVPSRLQNCFEACIIREAEIICRFHDILVNRLRN